MPPEATFTALLEPRLGATTYNLGVPGVGPYEYLEILRRFGLPLEPRIVLLNVYEGNDLRDAVRFAEQRARGAQAGQSRNDAAEREPLRKTLLRHSYALSFVAGSIEHLDQRWRPQDVDFRYEVGVRGGRLAMNGGQADRDEVRTARRLLGGAIGLALWERALADFATLAAARGFVPVVTYIPAAYTAYAATVAFADPAIGRDLAAMTGRSAPISAAVCGSRADLSRSDRADPGGSGELRPRLLSLQPPSDPGRARDRCHSARRRASGADGGSGRSEPVDQVMAAGIKGP